LKSYTCLAKFAMLVLFVGGGAACSQRKSSSFTSQAAGVYQGTVASVENLIAKSAVQLKIVGLTRSNVCSGSVLSPGLVLTAAHCVFEVTAAQVKVSVVDGSDRAVKKILIHPSYEPLSLTAEHFALREGYDLAILQLDERLPSNYQPMVLKAWSSSANLELLNIAGFGRSSNDSQAPAIHTLRVGNVRTELKDLVRVLNTSEGVSLQVAPANSEYARILQFHKGPEDAGLCKGDSGGPVYLESAGQLQLLGVIAGLGVEGVCAETLGQLQYATALTNGALRFIQTSALAAQESVVIENLPTAAADSTDFEYYFASGTGPEFNQSLDLRNKRLVIDTYKKDGKEFAKLVNPSVQSTISVQTSNAAQPPCKGAVDAFVDFNLRLSPLSADGLTPLLARSLSVHNQKLNFDQAFEARIKHVNGKYQFVILTPHGFVTKSFSVQERCSF
jgi:hypothetical protein